MKPGNCKIIFLMALCRTFGVSGQVIDTTKQERWSVHAQGTFIDQVKPAFSAPYTGPNSLQTNDDNQLSVTSTLFLGLRLWKGASVYLNPEVAGGSGLSKALGVAAAPNGETFRVGSSDPKLYLARLYYRQVFSLTDLTVYQGTGFNQLAGRVPARYFAFTAGKISIADYFDHNVYSHDPRTHFMSWGLMNNGAWDYPANTRGYTPGIVLEYVSQSYEFRYGACMMPLTANGNDMNTDISRASAHSLELVRNHTWQGLHGAIRVLAFFNTCNMGNYTQSVANQPVNPSIESTRNYGRSKYGFGVNMEQAVSNDAGFFFRAGWNDGHNETWAFTEIDQTVSGGFCLAGSAWNRKLDNVGLAYVVSGISKQHRDYLKAGGKGFMLGDGNLNYGYEHLLEFNYLFAVPGNQVFFTGGYQYLLNPGYNRDRKGPVHIFSVRVHLEI